MKSPEYAWNNAGGCKHSLEPTIIGEEDGTIDPKKAQYAGPLKYRDVSILFSSLSPANLSPCIS
jgi:hypothetical protein